MKPYSIEFTELINVNNFENRVNRPTNISGHTLDLVLAQTDSDFVSEVDVMPIDSNISDHALITFTVDQPRPKLYKKTITFRNYRGIDQTLIAEEIEGTLNSIDTSLMCAGELVREYNDFYRSVENRYCPEIVKTLIIKDDSPWYDSSVASLRKKRRKAERKWRRLQTDLSRSEYVAARRTVVSHVKDRKVEYYKGCVASCDGNQKRLFAVLNSLMGRNGETPMPSYISGPQLASDFADFFESKITHIRGQLDGVPVLGDFSVNLTHHFEVTQVLDTFRPVEVESVLRYIRELKKTFCQLDPINISKLPVAYESSAVFVVEIINQCFRESCFVSSEKLALLRPLLKKIGLDPEKLANYRPVSNLSFLSKIIERAILHQLLPLLEANGVVPSLQSAYRKCHSTETALCKVYNDLVQRVCEGRSSLLVLLDLSAAFHTIDHQMLFEDMWTFGIRGSALLLLKLYL